MLFELLTGRRAFDGKTITDILVAVMTHEPDWTAVPATTSPRIVELLRRCWKKDPRERLRDIGDARIELQSPEPVGTVDVAPSKPVRGKYPLSSVVAAVLLAVLALTFALLYFRQTALEPQLAKLQLLPPEKSAFGAIAVSPDGRRLAFTAADAAGRRTASLFCTAK